MTNLTPLATQISTLAESRRRVIVAIAGPPASGKSTLVAKLQALLGEAVVVPMDGFHLDNDLLEKRGLMARKGSPESFDADGYYALMSRIKRGDSDVYAPIFDRTADLSRAAAIDVPREAKIVLTEGNYLLLNQSPWDGLASLCDLTVFLDVPEVVLKERLMMRWLDQGLSSDVAQRRAESNDLPNAVLVNNCSRQADLVINYC